MDFRQADIPIMSDSAGAAPRTAVSTQKDSEIINLIRNACVLLMCDL